MDQDALVDRVARAVAAARLFDEISDWDREVAQVALRRWRSYTRRHKGDGSYEDRERDLARGLLERMDPERMDDPGWNKRAAKVAAEILRVHLP